jgi:3-hydroxyacyl-CoA dehydrogenase
MPIQKACVIGAGVMGAGIAAQIANAGIPVLLLDIVPKDGSDRSAIAKGAIEKLLKADPAPLMSKAAARLITPGNIEDDLDQLGDVDWVVEAIIERLDLKQGLYHKLEGKRKKGSILSSNTSTIPLKTLVEGMPETVQADFCITHFFNPPRYMRLLEIVGGPKTRAQALKDISDFGDRMLGKTIVHAKDTPGFVGNRIGVFWMQAAVNAALDLDLTVEEADAIMGRPIGAPKTGLFGLLDLVGLDLMPHVDKSMASLLAPDDAYMKLRRPWPLLEKMIADGYTGRKGKGGFYRLNTEGGGKVKESVNLKTGAYARTQGQGRAICLAGPLRFAFLRRLFGARDRRGCGLGRSGHEDRLQLEARPLRDDRPDGCRLVRRKARCRKNARAGFPQRCRQGRWLLSRQRADRASEARRHLHQAGAA